MEPVGSPTVHPGGALVADVLLLLPLARTYTYSVPEALAGRVRRGAQVACAVRNRAVSGLVIAVRAPRDDDPPRLSAFAGGVFADNGGTRGVAAPPATFGRWGRGRAFFRPRSP